MSSSMRVSFGEQLRSARQAAGLSTEDVGHRLRLDPSFISALEASDYRHLPAPAYTRGYIRSYALLVNCNADMLIAEYNAVAGDDPDLVEVESIAHEGRNNDAVILWGGVGIAAVLLVSLAVWAYEYFDSRASEQLSPVSQELTDATPAIEQREAVFPEEQTFEIGIPSEEKAAEVVVNEMVSKETAPDANASLVVESVPVSADSANVVPENAESIKSDVAPVAPSGDDLLSLRLRGQSWVEVYDANDFRLVYGLFDERRANLELTGQAPFRVILGDARVVELTINGAGYGIGRYIRANNAAVVRVYAPARTESSNN